MNARGTVSNPIKQGILRTLSWLSVIVWLIVAFIAAGITVGQTSYPLAFGWILLAALMWIAAVTAARWVRVLPGMLGVAALNAIWSVISGHFGLNPPKPIARSLAGLMAVALIGAAYLSTTYINRRLAAIDRIALTLAIASVLVGLSRAQLAVPATVAIAVFLSGGAGYRYSHR